MTDYPWEYWRFDDDDGDPPIFVKRSGSEIDTFMLVDGRWELIDPDDFGGAPDPWAHNIGDGEGVQVTLTDVPLLPEGLSPPVA